MSHPFPPSQQPPTSLAMSSKRFEAAINHAETFVDHTMRSTGRLIPMLHVLCTAAPDAITTFPNGGIDGLEEAVGVLQGASRQQGAAAALFMTEAWLVMGAPSARIRPSQHPDRIETVWLTAVWPARCTEVSRFFRIVRKPDGDAAALEPLGTQSPGPAVTDSRVAGLLREILSGPGSPTSPR